MARQNALALVLGENEINTLIVALMLWQSI